ncbi:MAG: menaquinone biosynthesis protein [Armatimonadetes bacterium]|nr:menaquinone biosynthesis protein [Armatimonadota bacterium]
MRLGVLSYINSMPLSYGLESGAAATSCEVIAGDPNCLNRLAAAGQLDVTPISSIEFARLAGSYAMVPGFCLAAPGPVQSVRLFSRLPLGELPGRPVAVTTASATSRALLQVLVPGVRVEDLTGEPRLEDEQPAALLIGDRALRGVAGAEHIYDLGELWVAETGLPMVFAVWIASRSFLAASPSAFEEVQAVLLRSLEWGESHPSEVVHEACRRTGLPAARIENYFSALRFRLDSPAQRGLVEFFRRAAAVGLIPAEGLQLLRQPAAA